MCLGEFECLSVWYIQGGARDEHRGAQSLDLHSGFNILKRCILDEVGKPSDLVLLHPPYHNIVVYSGNVGQRAAS